MNSYKDNGVKNFLEKKFKLAQLYFSLALQEDPYDNELKMLVDLAYFGENMEEEALSLYDFYITTLKDKEEFNKSDLYEVMDSLEQGLHQINSLSATHELNNFILQESGISFEDFIKLVELKGSFKLVFENIMFSTKVLISKKEDFIYFLNLLLDNGFKEMAVNYFESALNLFPSEPALREFAKKIEFENDLYDK